MRWNRLVCVVGLGLMLPWLGCGKDNGTGPGAASSSVQFDTFQKAAVVIGQADMVSKMANMGGTTNAVGLSTPQGAGAGSFYLADQVNNRVLGYTSLPGINGVAATFVLGQSDFTSSAGGTTSQSFNAPVDCVVSQNRLLVVDYTNNRVLVWNSLPKGNVSASVVIGQSDFVSSSHATTQSGLWSPLAIAASHGKLFLADYANRRVLIWNSIPTVNGVPADVVVGQPDFTTATAGLTASKMNVVGSVWSDGKRLVVGDVGNQRVLIWNSIPTANGAAADVVVGAPDFTTSGGGVSATAFNSPFGLTSDGTTLFVTDGDHNRVLIFKPFPSANGASAVTVLGQSDFTHIAVNDDNQDGAADAGPSARVMSGPTGLRLLDRRLLVSDTFNNRILIFVSK
jgi:hypothetical protein